MEFICLQIKLWDTDSAGVFGSVWGGGYECFVCGNVEGVPTWGAKKKKENN